MPIKSGPAKEAAKSEPPRTAPLIHLSSDFIRAKEYLETIIASTSDAICTTDIKGRIIFFSPGAEHMIGVKLADIVGRYAHQFYAGGREEADKIMRQLRRHGSIQNYETVLKAQDGRRIHVSMSASLLKDRNGKVMGTLGISKDITQRVEFERRLKELSITDNLTGLYNQRHFHDKLGKEASRARRQRYKLSLILIDLDGFKKINDQRGHLEGDRILKAFAHIILQNIRKEMDSAFRYGGDEFVILLPGLEAPRAEKIAQRILSSSRHGITHEGVSFSYGVSTLASSSTLADLVQQADKRMFRMKAENAKIRKTSAAKS